MIVARSRPILWSLLLCPLLCSCTVQPEPDPDPYPIPLVRDPRVSSAPQAAGAVVLGSEGELRLRLVGLTARRSYVLSLNCVPERPDLCIALEKLGAIHDGEGYWDFHEFSADGGGGFAASIRPAKLEPMHYKVKLLVKDPSERLALMYANDVEFDVATPDQRRRRALTDGLSQPVPLWVPLCVAFLAVGPPFMMRRSARRLRGRLEAELNVGQEENLELSRRVAELQEEVARVDPATGSVRMFEQRPDRKWVLRTGGGEPVELDNDPGRLVKLITDYQAKPPLPLHRQGYRNLGATAQDTVSKAIRRCVEEILQKDAPFGHYLAGAVVTGSHCHLGRPTIFGIRIEPQ